MKVLTPEEESAHNKAVWEGGTLGALGGLVLGAAGVFGATRRFHAFRQLSVPFRVFLVTSTASFGGVISADRYSRAFEAARHADSGFVDQSQTLAQQVAAQKTLSQRAKAFVSEQRYPIVFGSWAVSMVAAFALVSRNPYLTGQQKLVQARVYAQGLTLAVLVASFALEGNDMRAGKGRWETVRVVDPDDPEGKRMVEKTIHHEAYSGEDQWMDMLDSQEKRMRQRGVSVRDGDGNLKAKKKPAPAQKKDDSKGEGQDHERKEKKTEAKSS